MIDYPLNALEVLVIDGMSDDGTRDAISKFSEQHSFIKLVDNEDLVVPHALNKGIALAKGEVIIRMDVHCIYPPNYVSTLVQVLLESGADNVGCYLETIPDGDGIQPRAIALATSHPFGIGNSKFRLNCQSEEPIIVDTVPFGCFRREVFQKFGLFDEELIRNQDNEFNTRITSGGGKILLIPNLKIKYFARKNFRALWRMFFQYGEFGPLVDAKVGRIGSLRRYIPGLFVMGLFIPLVLSFFWKPCGIIGWAVFLSHSALNLFYSLAISITQKRMMLAPFLFIAFLASHLSYGLGYIYGYFHYIFFGKKTSTNTSLSR